MPDSLWPHGPHQAPLSKEDSPGKNTGVGCHTLLQGIFSILESNLYLLQIRKSLPTLVQSSFLTDSSARARSVSFSSVQWLSHVRLFATPWIASHQASLSITNSRSSLRLTSIESVTPSNHLIVCRPLLLLLSIPPSIRVFSSESTLHMRWPKHWGFGFSITPSKEIPELIFRMDWLNLLAVQATHKSLLQHHSSKASILRCSAFFTV